jgi:hypothetical protein
MIARTRRRAAVASAAVLVLFGAGCADDADDTGDADIETPDLDPGAGDGVPGDSEDESGDVGGGMDGSDDMDGVDDTDDDLDVDSPDLDPGAGDDLPGDSDDEGAG